MSGRLLVRDGTVVTGGSAPDVIADGVVFIENGEIAWLGPSGSWDGSELDARLIDAHGCLVTPGLIDAHNHPIHFLSKGIADDRELGERSYQRIWPYEAALTDDEAYLSALGTFAEMLCHGTTCFADPGSLHPHAVARAAAETGIRGIISREAFDVPDHRAPTAPRRDHRRGAGARARHRRRAQRHGRRAHPCVAITGASGLGV